MREMGEGGIRPVVWIRSSHEDLKKFPADIQDEMGFSGVLEIRSNYASDTYRAVYATKIGDAIYVLHAFQKKSKRGIGTPKQEIALIRRRLQRAQELAQGG